MSQVGTLSVGILGDISGLKKSFDDATKGVEAFAKKTQELGKQFTDAGKQLSLLVTGPLVALAGFSVKAYVEADRLETALVGLAGGANQAAQYITAIQEASQGTISRLDALGIANRALTLNVVDSADKMKQLTEIAITLGQAQGITAKQAVSDLTLALGRQSPMILDNLGITLKMEEAYAIYAKQLDKSVDALTATEKQQAFLNAALEKGQEVVKRLGGVHLDGAAKLEQLTASFADTREEIGKIVFEAIEPLIVKVKDWIDWFRTLDEGTQKLIVRIGAVAAAVGPLLVGIGYLITAVGKVTAAFRTLSAVLLAHPIYLVIAAITAMTTAWVVAQEGLESFGDYWREFWIDLYNSLVSIWNGFVFVVETSVNAIIRAVNLIPLVDLSEIVITRASYVKSLEVTATAILGIGEAADETIGHLRSLNDQRVDLLIENLEQLKRSLDETPSAKAIDEWTKKSTVLLETWKKMYPELDLMTRATTEAFATVTEELTSYYGRLDYYGKLMLRLSDQQVTALLREQEALTGTLRGSSDLTLSLIDLTDQFADQYVILSKLIPGTDDYTAAYKDLSKVVDIAEQSQADYLATTGREEPALAKMIAMFNELSPAIDEATESENLFVSAAKALRDVASSGVQVLSALFDSLESSIASALDRITTMKATNDALKEEYLASLQEIADAEGEAVKSAAETRRTGLRELANDLEDGKITREQYARDYAQIEQDYAAAVTAAAAARATAMEEEETAYEGQKVGIINILGDMLKAFLKAAREQLQLEAAKWATIALAELFVNPIAAGQAALASAAYLAGAGGLAIAGFEKGGLVAGALGEPVPAIVHGGEMVLTPEQQRGGLIDYGLMSAAFADALEEVLPGKDRPLYMVADGRVYARIMLPFFQREEQRLGLVTP